MRPRNIKFTKRKHSQYALFSLFLGILSVISEILVIIKSTEQNGDITEKLAFMLVFAMIFSIAGLSMGAWSLYGQRYFKTFGVLSVLTCLVAIVIFCIIVF